MSWDMVGEPDARKKARVWVDDETKLLCLYVNRGYVEFWKRRGMSPPSVSSSFLEFAGSLLTCRDNGYTGDAKTKIR